MKNFIYLWGVSLLASMFIATIEIPIITDAAMVVGAVFYFLTPVAAICTFGYLLTK